MRLGAPVHNGEYGLGIDVGDGTVSAAVCGAVDGGTTGATVLPLGDGRVTTAVDDGGRVALAPVDGTARTRHLVARVGDPVPVYAGDHPVPAAELVAAAVQRVRELAEAREGRPDSWTVLTVPPSWSGHRRAVLARALASSGVPRFSLVSAAVAAVHHHVVAGDLPGESTVAVYDLGAGTLDTAVVGPTPEEPLGHRAPPPAPLPWGGRDVDDAVVAHVVGCLGTPQGEAPGWARALRAACVAAKEALSTATVVRVDVDGSGDGTVRLTREELDEVLAEPTRDSAGMLAAAVAAAGLRLQDLEAVVLAGGGVRVPLVAEVLSGELGRPLVVGADPALTPALGAAALAAEALAVEALPVETFPVERQVAAATPVVAGSLPHAAPAGSDAPGRGPRRDRTRPSAAGETASRPPRRTPRRNSRLGRGVVVAGAAVGLVLLGPAAAGLFDAVVAPAPAGEEATAEDDAGVIARGTATVGGGSGGGTATRGGGTGGGAGSGPVAR
ncbi:hypothetical protein E4P41_19945, partial [Geodermatophilus sp. DF01-2]|uniref:Hsp70 family protein n=1 Tax=Geodermatophilus sp. DF01-2 TaxID=2559610 RepID=UPI0011038DBC